MSVACDDGSFSSPKSSQEGVAFSPFGRRTRFQTKCGEKLQFDILRATLITPPPYGHPLYKQRGSLQSAHNQQLASGKYSKISDALPCILAESKVRISERISNKSNDTKNKKVGTLGTGLFC